MRFEFVARNYETGEKLKQLTEQKLSKLGKYFSDEEPSAKINLKKEGRTFVTEVMLEYSGKLVRATATGDNFFDNLDVVLPKLEGQIRKYRTRFDKNNKNSAFKDAVVYGGQAEKDKKIVKQKKFVLTPMTVNEAAEEMELLGHSFYVFLEAKSNTVQVLYQRGDGDLGLIEPEV